MIPEAKTELITKKQTMPAPMEVFGDDGLDTSDLLISRLSLCQPLSKLVSEGRALPGEIVDSVSGEVLVKKGQSLEIIPVASYKEWNVLHLIDNQWKFIQKVPFTIKTATWAKEAVTPEGIQVRNDLAMNFFVLIAGKEQEFPYLLSFKRSSYYAGRKISTAIQKNLMLKRNISSTSFDLKSSLQTFDKFNFFVFDVEKKKDTTKEQMDIAKVWNERLSKAKANVEIHEDSEEAPF